MGNKKLVIGGLIAGGLMVGVAGLILGAGLAKAEPMTVDGHYLLNMHMGKVPGSDAQLVALGHTACVELGYGLSPYQVGQYLTQMDLQLSMMDTADVVGTATVTYCPQFASEPPMGYPDVGGQRKVFSLGPPRTSPNDTGLPVTPPQTSTPWEGVPQLPGPPQSIPLTTPPHTTEWHPDNPMTLAGTSYDTKRGGGHGGLNIEQEWYGR